MSREFFAERVGRNNALAALAVDTTHNPFLTDAYVAAMLMLKRECWIVGLREGQRVEDAAIAVLRRGRLSVIMEIPSLPASAADQVFWDGIYALGRRLKITDLFAGTFASQEFEIPALKGETSRTSRQEYIVSLDGDYFARLSSNHKRNIKKARAAGVVIRHSSECGECLSQHQALMTQSLHRRAARGEAVPDTDSTAEHRALVHCGAGEIFQAVLEERVLSSVLLLRAAKVAYYESAGTSPEGMSLGASHFLIHGICECLFRQGVPAFNLGGAASGSSLARFKAGFGATEVRLSACSCYVGPTWRRKLRSAYSLARHDPRQFLRALCGQWYTMLVYAIDTDSMAEQVQVAAGTRFAPLSAEDLLHLPADDDDPGFRDRQLERLRRFGTSYAFGVFDSGALAHVSWLLPNEAVRATVPDLKLRNDEAEITACETLPRFRGRNLYPFAVQQILAAARQQGIRRVYMKTRKTNLASQAGILKAGLGRIGTLTLITAPVLPSRCLILRRLKS